MKLNQLIIVFLGFVSPLFCKANDSKEYDMEPLKFIFDKWEDSKIKDAYNDDSYWSLYRGISTIVVCLELACRELPWLNDELSFLRSGIVVNLMPFMDINNTDDVIGVRLSFLLGSREEQLLSDMLKQSNLRKLEENFGVTNRARLEKYAKLHIITTEWDKDYEDYILKIKLPVGTSEHIYINAFVYSMNIMNKLIDNRFNKSDFFQQDDIAKSITEDVSIICKVLSIRMLIRTLVEPDLFTMEDKRIIFHPICDLKRKEIEAILEKYPTGLGYATYACPVGWEEVITKMSYRQFIQALLDQLDSVFPERKSEIKQQNYYCY